MKNRSVSFRPMLTAVQSGCLKLKESLGRDRKSIQKFNKKIQEALIGGGFSSVSSRESESLSSSQRFPLRPSSKMGRSGLGNLEDFLQKFRFDSSSQKRVKNFLIVNRESIKKMICIKFRVNQKKSCIFFNSNRDFVQGFFKNFLKKLGNVRR